MSYVLEKMSKSACSKILEDAKRSNDFGYQLSRCFDFEKHAVDDEWVIDRDQDSYMFYFPENVRTESSEMFFLMFINKEWVRFSLGPYIHDLEICNEENFEAEKLQLIITAIKSAFAVYGLYGKGPRDINSTVILRYKGAEL